MNYEESEQQENGGYHFRDVANVLPEFDPIKGDIDIEEWIEKLEEYGELYSWNHVAIRHYALSKLTGVARTWRDSLSRNPRTWMQWKTLLRENFSIKKSIKSVRMEAQNYRRKTGQNVIEYFYEKLAKCNQARMAEEESIEWIVDGLNNLRFRDYLGPLNRYVKPSDLLSDLKTGDLYIREQGVRKIEKNASYVTKSQEIICYICRKTGHIAKECQKSKRDASCFKCGKRGHYARVCKTNTTANTNGAPVHSSNAQEGTVLHVSGHSHQKYYKDAKINGQDIQSYIDLGSSVNTIRKDVAKRVGINAYYEALLKPLVGYGDGRVQPLGIFTANIAVDGVEVRTEIYVVPDECQQIPLLIGHPFTEHPGVVILSTAKELKVAATLEELQIGEISRTEKTAVWAKEAQVIPNNYLGHVTVATEIPNQDLCIEGGLRVVGPLLPRCVVTTDEDGQTLLPILNLTGQELSIKQGEKIARGEVCEESVYQRQINEESVTEEQVDTDLIAEDKERLVQTINEYKDLVANKVEQLGCTNKMQLSIELDSARPVYHRPYRLSYHERKQLKDMVDELKMASIIEDSASPFASPVLLIRKKNHEMRMCVDYRAINKITVKDRYPLPLIDDQLDRLQGQTFFTSLDLFSGYYQIPIDEKSKDKTAFITPDGQFQFTRMPFGLCNAPSKFQRLMNLVLGNLRYDVAMAYLDDVIIPSVTVEEGLDRLKKVLEVFREAGLTLNLKKCHFLKRRIGYLGFEISKDGIEPGRAKIQSLDRFPQPKDIKGIRSFMGLASYFRRFVRGFAVIAKPLTDLLKRNAEFTWDDAQAKAFTELKTKLVSSPILAVYNPEASTELHTDACSIGIGAVLLQKQTDGKWHPISFYSRKTTEDEAKYHSYELEALAIVCALDKFRVYLLGITFIIRTDCNSLKLLESKRDLSPRIGRWFVKLSEFHYKIEYLKGENNQVADALSRNPVGDTEDTPIAGLPVLGIKITTDWVAAMQRGDPEILQVRDDLEKGDQKVHEKFTLYNARVYKITKGRWRLYVPLDLRYEIVAEAHKEIAHLGIDKTLAKLKQTYYFRGMREFVTQYINRCVSCLYHKVPGGRKPGFLHPLDKGSVPFQTIHIDHLGPLVITSHKNKYVVAIVCGFSKYVVLKATKDVETLSTIQFLKETIVNYGKPLKIISDRGAVFTSHAFEKFCSDHFVQHIKIASGAPRANGQVERVNSMILSGLATSTHDIECTDWDKRLLDVQAAINGSQHTVTRRTPYDLVFSYKVVSLSESPLTQEILLLNIELGAEYDPVDVPELLKKNQRVLSTQFNKTRKQARNFQIGDIVLVRAEAPGTGESRKLRPKYRGPYEISQIIGNDRYVVQDIEGEQQTQKKYQGILAVDRLKYVSTAKDYLSRPITRSSAKSQHK